MSLAARLQRLEREVGHLATLRREWSWSQVLRKLSGELPPDELPALVLEPGQRCTLDVLRELFPSTPPAV